MHVNAGMQKSVLTVDGFFQGANELRSHFEERFQNPREARGDRFIWDWWHVPGQYTALRTPAYHFFPQKLYQRFHNELVWWGRRTLGCHDISPPWMSCYVDGCRQELHGDLPHGPWAFVFSLTPWRGRKFTGGETVLLRDEILSYWSGMASTSGLEREHITREVPALFNRLTVFDPRIPHGVKLVQGIQDPLEGRLVIHGWFVQPRPFIEGPLSLREMQGAIDDLSGILNEKFSQGLDVQGVLSVRMAVSSKGRVTSVDVLTDVLRHPQRDRRIERAIVTHVRRFLLGLSFSPKKGGSHVTLPLVFERHV